MNSHTLSFYCDKILAACDNTTFCGVVDSRDLLKAYNAVRPCAWTTNVLAVNVDNQHWFVIIWKDNSLYMLDPLNVDVSEYNKPFADFVTKKYQHSYYEFNCRLQSLSSSLCGAFCLYFVYCVCLLRQTVAELEGRLHSVNLNDSLIVEWLEELDKS